MKKFLSIILALFIITSISGCNHPNFQNKTISTVATTNNLNIPGANRIDIRSATNQDSIYNIYALDNDKILLWTEKFGTDYTQQLFIYTISSNKFIPVIIQSPTKEYIQDKNCLQRLEDGGYFFYENNTGIFLNKDLSFIKEVQLPNDNIENYYISPNGKYLAYYTENGLTVSDINQKNKKLLLRDIDNDNWMKAKIYKPIGWSSDSKSIFYKRLRWEGVLYSGIIDMDGKSTKDFSKLLSDKFIKSTNSDIMMYTVGGNDNIFDIGIYNSKTDEVKSLIPPEESKSLSYNNTISSKCTYLFYATQLYSEEKQKYFITFKVVNTQTKAILQKYENISADTDIFDATFTPNEKYLIFTCNRTGSDSTQLYITNLNQ